MAVSAQQLISTLYECVTEPRGEQAFVEKYAECVGAAGGAVLVITDSASERSYHLASARVDPSFAKAYEQYYGALNVFIQRAKKMLPQNVVQPGHAICPEDEMVRTEYYNDYMRPQKIYHSLGVMLPLDGGWHVHLGACRPKSAGAFGAEEFRTAQALVQHLQPAMRIRERFLSSQRQGAALSHFMDQLPYGILFLNAQGRILEANQRAAEILRSRDGLSSDHGQLVAAFAREAALLRKFVARVTGASQGVSLEPGGALRISRCSGRQAFNLVITPFRIGRPWDAAPFQLAAALVIVVDPEQETAGTLLSFSLLYSLTPAESRVCGLLVNGKSPKGIADSLGITLNTVRTHIKRILSKTETSRQSELVRLALSSGPVR